MTMQRRGLPLAYMITIGNQAQTGLAETGAMLLRDDRVTALGLHIEGIDDLRAFERLACVADATGKPVVALKVGASAAGKMAALIHTAALTGSEAGADAFFQRLGFTRVDTLPQFFETLKLLHAFGPLSGSRITSMSCSGGEAGLVADTAARHGLSFPPLPRVQQNRLQSLLGPLVTPVNPLDYHTQIWGNGAATADTFATMMDTPADLSMVILDFLRGGRCSTEGWDPTLQACLDARRRSDGKLAVVSTLLENMPEAVADKLLDHGIVPLCGVDDACAAVAAAARCGRQEAAAPILSNHSPTRARPLDEASAKSLLARHGVTVPVVKTADTADGAATASAEIGFPVVLKGRGFVHKSENGAVCLGLDSAAEVREAALAMPTARLLVEEMIGDTVVELLVGVVRDEAHGFVLTLAAGGVLTEVLADRQSLLLPVERASIENALSKLRVAPLLAGFRGRPAADRDAVVDAVLSVQDYVMVQADGLQEIEINPFLCGTTRAAAADALIVREADDDR